MKQASSCKVILKYNHKFLVYLRDNKETIPFPNYWDLFGGGIEEGETLKDCITREIYEELELKLDMNYTETIPEDTDPIRYVAVFSSELNDVNVESMNFTGEGQKYGFFTRGELKTMKVVPHFRRYL